MPGIRGGVKTERPRVNQRTFSPLVYLHGDTKRLGFNDDRILWHPFEISYFLVFEIYVWSWVEDSANNGPFEPHAVRCSTQKTLHHNRGLSNVHYYSARLQLTRLLQHRIGLVR